MAVFEDHTGHNTAEAVTDVQANWELPLVVITTDTRILLHTDPGITTGSRNRKGLYYRSVLGKHPWALTAQARKTGGGRLHGGGA